MRCEAMGQEDNGKLSRSVRRLARENETMRRSVHDLSRLLANALTVWQLESRRDCQDGCTCLNCGFLKRCERAIREAEEVMGK